MSLSWGLGAPLSEVINQNWKAKGQKGHIGSMARESNFWVGREWSMSYNDSLLDFDLTHLIDLAD